MKRLMRLIKIAQHVFDAVVLAKNDDYKYIYDPDHKKHPGQGFVKTKSGWSKGDKSKSKKEEQNTESSQLEETYTPVVTQQQKDFVSKYYKKGKFSGESFIQDLGSFSSARSDVQERYSNQDTSKIQDKFHMYSGSHYGKSGPAKKLSLLSAYHFNMEKGDYHTDYSKEPPPTKKQLEAFETYIKKQQQVLVNSGLVTKDGKVKLFRNVGKSLFAYHTDGITINNYSNHYGETMEYRGAHLESWTFLPDFSWDGAKIYAEVPLEACLASCIGRYGNGNSFVHMGQMQCMVAASLVHQVTLCGKNDYCIESIKNGYLKDISEPYGSDSDDYEHNIAPASQEEKQEFINLKNSKNPQDKIKALNHKLCNKKEFLDLALTDNEDVQYNAILSKHADANLWQELANKTKYEKVQNGLLDIPNLPYKIVQQLANSKFKSVAQKANKKIEQKKQKDKKDILDSGDLTIIEKYTKQPDANPQLLDELREKYKDNTYVQKYVADSVNTTKETLKKIVNNPINAHNMIHVMKAVVDNPNTTTEIIDDIIDSEQFNKVIDKYDNGQYPEKLQKAISKNPKSSPHALHAVYDKGGSNTFESKELLSQNPNCDDDLASKLISLDNINFNKNLSKNHNLSSEITQKLTNNENLDNDALNDLAHHPNMTVNALKTLSKKIQYKPLQEHIQKRIDKKMAQVSESISDDQVGEAELEFLKKYFPKSCQGKSVDELIILFKTLAKRGYFSKGGGNGIEQDTVVDEDDETQESPDNKDVLNYLYDFFGVK